MMRIAQTNTVIEFALAENLILLIGGVLKEYQKNNGANVHFLNIPQNIPPDAPRIIVSSRNAIINISLTRIEIISKIPNHILEDVHAAFLFTKNNVDSIVSQLWVPELKYSWLGLIAVVDFPQNITDKTALQLAKPYFDRLLNIKRENRELGSFEIKFGFKEGKYFKNFNISCFETRDIKIDHNRLSSLQNFIDLEEVSAITNAGLRIIYDINNKKGEQYNTLNADFEDIIGELVKSLKSITAELNVEDLI